MTKKTYGTSDIVLASTLVCHGHKICGTEREGKWVRFVFEETESLDADIGRYVKGALLVDPVEFLESRNAMRGYIPRDGAD